jgi:hypothetical protein
MKALSEAEQATRWARVNFKPSAPCRALIRAAMWIMLPIR